MRDTERARGRDTGRGRSRLHAGSPMRDSIPGPEPKAGAKPLSHPGIPVLVESSEVETQPNQGIWGRGLETRL